VADRLPAAWWERGIIYQIYPRSFMDSNGDGIGDLDGIRTRLPYLRWLGVDAIWLSPIYPSPMADFGYDIADFIAVDPCFGTMARFDALVEATHASGLKLLLDFVPNHTSVEHPWFRDSRRSRDDPKRDWYIWRDPAADGGPPNNWLSVFGGSAWEWDEATGQYYYHAFLKEQPDLNWRNPDVRRAMLDVMRFWLDRGVDGFRVDVIWHLIKDLEFRDNPPNPNFRPGMAAFKQQLRVYNTDRPEVHEVITEIRSVLDEYPDRMMVGEIYLPPEQLVAYYGAEGRGVHLPFNFQLVELPWSARVIADAVARYEALLPPHGWPNWVLGNHDRPRIASRVGAAQARVAAMLLLTLRGTPTMYYGDEIGMHDVAIPPELVQDPWGRNEPGLGVGRDPERTPMQWSPEPNAGFTTGRPWLPVADDYRVVNVEVERDDPLSMLTLYRQLIALRRAEPALQIGRYEAMPADGDLVAFVRTHGERRLLVLLNLGPEPCAFDSNHWAGRGRIVLSTHVDRDGEQVADLVTLRSDEGVIIAID
jgi:alpha-glucosidase